MLDDVNVTSRELLPVSLPYHVFAFHAGYMDQLPEDAVEFVIAHELAHAVLGITDANHLDPTNTKYDEWGFSESEYDADEMAEYWGFDKDIHDQAAEELYQMECTQEEARE